MSSVDSRTQASVRFGLNNCVHSSPDNCVHSSPDNCVHCSQQSWQSCPQQSKQLLSSLDKCEDYILDIGEHSSPENCQNFPRKNSQNYGKTQNKSTIHQGNKLHALHISVLVFLKRWMMNLMRNFYIQIQNWVKVATTRIVLFLELSVAG